MMKFSAILGLATATFASKLDQLTQIIQQDLSTEDWHNINEGWETYDYDQDGLLDLTELRGFFDDAGMYMSEDGV